MVAQLKKAADLWLKKNRKITKYAGIQLHRAQPDPGACSRVHSFILFDLYSCLSLEGLQD